MYATLLNKESALREDEKELRRNLRRLSVLQQKQTLHDVSDSLRGEQLHSTVDPSWVSDAGVCYSVAGDWCCAPRYLRLPS